MAYSLTGHVATWSTTSNGYTTAAQDTTGADLLLVAFSQGGSVNNGVVSDNKGNTWHQLTQQLSNGKSSEIWYAYNANVGTGHTFTCSGTANSPAMAIAWFAGSQTASDPFDQQNGSSVGFGSTLATGSVTPTAANELVFTSFQGDGDASAATINASFTVSDSVTDAGFGHQLAAAAYLIQTTATAANPTWTRTSGNSTLAAAIATFKAAAAAGGTFDDDPWRPPVAQPDSSIVSVWG